MKVKVVQPLGVQSWGVELGESREELKQQVKMFFD